jgi:glycerol-3-phosphate dehydrogenase
MNNDERRELIKEDKTYGKIVCRCETVTEGEIRNAIRRPLGAKTLDGVKRRKELEWEDANQVSAQTE